ncbi:hypothetical protein ACFL27_28310, partial [candidate division CSSED10-310 bacterium]
VSVSEMIIGDLFDEKIDILSRRSKMQEVLDRENLVVFAETNVVQDVVEGITSMAQANGMAGLQSNTILLGWPKERKLLVEFLRIMRRLEKLKKSLVIARIQPRYLFPREGIQRTIHVWWGGLQRNGDLMILLGYLLTRNREWENVKIKIMSIASSEIMKTKTEKYLAALIPEIRIAAEPRVIMKPKDLTVREVIHQESSEADVVFFGLATLKPGEEVDYAQRLDYLAGDLPTVFFVKNSSLFMGELLQPKDIE